MGNNREPKKNEKEPNYQRMQHLKRSSAEIKYKLPKVKLDLTEEIKKK